MRLNLDDADEAIAAAKAISPPKDGASETPEDRKYWVAWDSATASLYDAVGRADQPLSALCLSGGGIRSASFSLGVIQTLAKRGWLPAFDYLSSVSGGGYIAGWLQAWISRWGGARKARRYVAKLGRVPRVDGKILGVPPRSPHAPEPRAVEHLREFSNFLTPRLGLFSGDSWALVAIVLRNIVLNWLVFLPIFAGAMGLPVLAMYVFDGRVGTSPPAIKVALALACVAATLSFFLQRRRGAAPEEVPPAKGVERSAWRRRARRILAPASAALLGAAAVLLSWAAPPVEDAHLFPGNPLHLQPSDPDLLLVLAAWTLIVPLAGWVLAWIIDGAVEAVRPGRTAPDRRRGWGSLEPAPELLALIVSGALAGGALVLVARGWSALLPTLAWLQWHHAASFAAAAPPILVLSLLFARSVFIAFTGRYEHLYGDSVSAQALGEAAREWWGRQSGVILGGASAWVLFFLIAGTGEWLLGVDGASLTAAAAWVGVGGGAALAGMSEKIPFGGMLKKSAANLLKANAVVLAAAVGLAALLAVLAGGNIAAGGAACRALPWFQDCPLADPAPGAPPT